MESNPKYIIKAFRLPLRAQQLRRTWILPTYSPNTLYIGRALLDNDTCLQNFPLERPNSPAPWISLNCALCTNTQFAVVPM